MTSFRLKVGNPFNFFNEVIQTLIIFLTPTSCSDLHLLAKAAINIVGVKKKWMGVNSAYFLVTFPEAKLNIGYDFLREVI